MVSLHLHVFLASSNILYYRGCFVYVLEVDNMVTLLEFLYHCGHRASSLADPLYRGTVKLF